MTQKFGSWHPFSGSCISPQPLKLGKKQKHNKQQPTTTTIATPCFKSTDTCSPMAMPVRQHPRWLTIHTRWITVVHVETPRILGCWYHQHLHLKSILRWFILSKWGIFAPTLITGFFGRRTTTWWRKKKLLVFEELLYQKVAKKHGLDGTCNQRNLLKHRGSTICRWDSCFWISLLLCCSMCAHIHGNGDQTGDHTFQNHLCDLSACHFSYPLFIPLRIHSFCNIIHYCF